MSHSSNFTELTHELSNSRLDHSQSFALIQKAIDSAQPEIAAALIVHWDDSTINHREKAEIYLKAVNSGFIELINIFDRFTISQDIKLRAFKIAINNSDLPATKTLLNGALREYSPSLLPVEQMGEVTDPELIIFLVGKGVDINFNRGSPLIGAITKGMTENIKLLFNLGADIHFEDNLPFKHAAIQPFDNSLDMLLNLSGGIDADGLVFCTRKWMVSDACREIVTQFEMNNAITQLMDESVPTKIGLSSILNIPEPKYKMGA